MDVLLATYYRESPAEARNKSAIEALTRETGASEDRFPVSPTAASGVEGNIRRRMPTAPDDRPVENTATEAALRESEQRFRGVFDSAATGFVISQPDGSITAVNRSMCQILGYSEKELLERTAMDITEPSALDPFEHIRRQLLDATIDHAQFERTYVHKDGHTIWAAIAIAVVRPGDAPPYFVSQITDITRRKNAEEALAHYSADLERSNTELQSFAYVASHDLQQPLRTVSSYAHLLAERYLGSLDQRADRWIKHISDGVEQMQRLINDLLLLAQIRSDGDGFSPTDITSISQRLWDTLQQRYTMDSSLTFGDLPMISANAAQIELLMQNLFDNAFKYRRRGVRLEVRIVAGRHTERDQPAWEFSVRDNGIGFDMINALRVFDLFSRLHSADEYEGTGIGLTICKRIVERHHGRIWVESAPGAGSTFFFTLPDHQA
jgi:PAS domain S-box-containing protein